MAFPNESPAYREARNRAMEAMLTMRKIDIAEVERAADAVSEPA